MKRYFNENTLQKAGEALFHIPSHDREVWLRMAFALFSEFGDAALELWLDWSQTADNYNHKDALRTWKSIKPGAITIASLFFEARRCGWQPNTSHLAQKALHANKKASKLKLKARAERTERERLARQEFVRKKAEGLFHGSPEADPNHPYLLNKQVQPFNLRQYKSSLMVPLVDENGLANLQFIHPDGSKRFLKGGRVQGAYSSIGKVERYIYICEGWATAASIHMLTGEAVFCAMNAGNLLPVANMSRAKCPVRHLILAGDNDTGAIPNTGAIAAREAAVAIRVEVMLPEFPKGHSGTDWNDWHQIQLEGGAA